MHYFRLLSTSALVMLFASAAMAQEQAASGDKASWAFSYILVFLFVALGLMAVCRPGSRSSEIKRVDDEEE
jgi:hypothetical protein